MAAVSGATNYLLAGDKIGPAKLQKATKLGVQIISESDFEAMIGSVEPSVSMDVGTEHKKENEKIAIQGELF